MSAENLPTKRRGRVTTTNQGPSMTRQSEKDNCDINIMVAKMTRGEAVNLATREGSYGDFSTVGDFTESRNQTASARSDFMELPSKIRAHFKNDVEHLLRAFEDPDQADQLREFGLITDQAEDLVEPPPGPAAVPDPPEPEA